MSAETAAARMARILALVPWIAAHDGPTVDEICERFDISPDQLVKDLEVVWLVGLPPYTPDALIDVVHEDDRVWIRFAEVFEAPQDLTPEQAVALLSAGESVLALPGSDPEGPLARGVAKVAAVLGVEPDSDFDVGLGGGRPEIVDVLRQGVEEHRRVHIDYYSYGRDTQTERDVDPYVIHAADGALYLFAYCHLAQDQRRFRIDRIAAARLRDERYEPPLEVDASQVFQPDDDDPRVVLRLQPAARWVLEQYPVEAVAERDDGTCDVTLAIAAVPWLERLLVNLGGDATVVSAPGDLARTGRRAAARILARYR